MNMLNIYQKIARENGVSVEEVKREIQAAIQEAYRNPSAEAAMIQCRIPRAGKLPTPEEVIDYVVSEVIKRQ